jgi:FdhD protein
MWRYERGAFHPEAFPLPEEARLVLVVNGTPWTVLSYTPGEEAYLALGHLFLSGVLTRAGRGEA